MFLNCHRVYLAHWKTESLDIQNIWPRGIVALTFTLLSRILQQGVHLIHLSHRNSAWCLRAGCFHSWESSEHPWPFPGSQGSGLSTILVRTLLVRQVSEGACGWCSSRKIMTLKYLVFSCGTMLSFSFADSQIVENLIWLLSVDSGVPITSARKRKLFEGSGFVQPFKEYSKREFGT